MGSGSAEPIMISQQLPSFGSRSARGTYYPALNMGRAAATVKKIAPARANSSSIAVPCFIPGEAQSMNAT
jgi:hypothetical protein